MCVWSWVVYVNGFGFVCMWEAILNNASSHGSSCTCRLNQLYKLYVFVWHPQRWIEDFQFQFRHKVKPDLVFISFVFFFFFFSILFVLCRKACLLPDRSVPPVVVHYGSGQSYFSSAATPILMNLSQKGEQQQSIDRKSKRKTIQKEIDIKTRLNKWTATEKN